MAVREHGEGVSFAPEAHLPRERRLVVDAAGVTLETALGIQHRVPWSECRAVVLWSDRAELVINEEVVLVVRSSDWHRGSVALEAIGEQAPPARLFVMPHDPEPEPMRYALRGLAATSSVVVVVLLLSLALLAALCFSVYAENGRVFALFFGLLCSVGSVWTLRAMIVRLRVPSRWREAAAVRGRTSVSVDSTIARAPEGLLALAEPALLILAGLTVGLLLAAHAFNAWPPMLLLILAVAVHRERARRARRSEGPAGPDSQMDGEG